MTVMYLTVMAMIYIVDNESWYLITTNELFPNFILSYIIYIYAFEDL